MEGLRLISFNANGLRAPLKRRAIFNDLRKTKSGIIFLQETHSTAAEEKIWISEWGGQGYFSHGRSNARGVAILFSKDFNPKIEQKITDEDGRFIILQIKVGDLLLTLANLYAPTQSEAKDQDLFIGKVDETLATLEVQNLLLGGDFNIQLDRKNKDKGRRSSHVESYAAKIKSLLEDYSLEDIWRSRNPSIFRGTFHRGTYSARLDYWFIPAQFSPHTIVKISPHPLSDHCILSIKITLTEVKRGPGFWKFDNLLLADKDFIEEMTAHIQEAQLEDLPNPNLQWEWLKYKMRLFSIQFSITKSRKRKQLVRDLEERLMELAEKHDMVDSQDVIEETKSIKRELGEIAQTKASAAAFRAKAKWALHGEKPSAYFLGLEKRQSRNNAVTSLLDSQGHTITDNKDILEMERVYFENIYTETPSDLDPIDLIPLSETDVPTISDLNKRRINRPFTIQEFHEALKELNKNKTPGTDGITPEFYLTFWELLKDDFMRSMEFSLDQGTLSDQQRTGVITLIPKKDLDRQSLTNWRPITLLNSDVKILSKALANRIQSCIREVISEDQTGFIRHRCISSNLLTVQAIIDYTDETSTQGLLLALDYSKAFDMVRWKLIEKALQLFGYGDFITSVVNTLFNGIKTSVSNAGYSSNPFYPTRGIRQGCCASPVLFVMAVELLAIIVRKNEKIKGLLVAEKEIKISQYADDATFFLQNPTDLLELTQTLENFARLSGLKMNNKKSHLLLLGNHKDPPAVIHGIQTADSVKILGMFYKPKMDKEEQYALNFSHRIKQIRQICGNWVNRNMSLKGKITLINALLISILQYPCSCTFTPERVLVEFKSIVTDFIWNQKRSKTAYNLLIQQIEDGGLKLADLETRLYTIHLGLIKQAWLNPTSTWVSLLANSLQTGDIKQVILYKADLVSKQPTRYQTFAQILKSWVKFHNFDPQTEGEAQEEVLWNNRNIVISGEPFFWGRWREAGINCVNDLLHMTEPRFSSHQEIAAEFNITCSFLQILQLRSAIPCKWKRLLRSPRRQDLLAKPLIKSATGSVIQITEVPAKKIYAAILPFKIPKISSQSKWNALYPVNEMENKDYWKEVYSSPYLATRESRLQSFQFRIIHRTIPCNKYLCNIRIKQEDFCSFCDVPTTDTLQHFFFSCHKTSTFWNSVCHWLSTQANFQVNIDEREFLFGVHRSIPQSRMTNFLTLLAKHFIFRQKLFHKANLDLTHFLRELKQKLGIEKFICMQENKPRKFSPWKQIYNALG